MPGLKTAIRSALGRAGLDVRRRRNVPFGVRWEDDIAYYLAGRSLGVAFDIGAHRGETANTLRQTFPGVHVHSFEPLPENFAALKAATSPAAVTAVNAAVTDTAGTIELALGETSQRASVHGADGPKLEVKALTVDGYLAANHISHVDLLKIDTEGAEDRVLRGASGLLESGATEFVLCECEFTRRPDEPHGDFRAIFDLLEPRSYRIVSFYTSGVDNLGWLWGDVLFRYAPRDRDPRWASRTPYRRMP
jgi:FkbM family methyltransferase